MRAARSSPAPLSTFLVECYWPGVTVEAFTEAAQRIRASVEDLRAEGERIVEGVSTLVPEDEAAYWTLEAPSAAVVERVFTRAGVTFERILAAIEVERPSVTTGRRGTRRDP